MDIVRAGFLARNLPSPAGRHPDTVALLADFTHAVVSDPPGPAHKTQGVL